MGSGPESITTPRVLTPAGFARVASRGRWTCPPHLDRLNRALLGVMAGRISRLMVSIPPRHGKSFLISHYFPAYYLGVFPEREFALCSYEADFAAEWGAKARDVMLEWGKPVFGVEVHPGMTSSARWACRPVGQTAPTGGMKTAGVGGPLTGRGAHVLVIDDPIKNAEEANSLARRNAIWDWYVTTARTRLEPGGAVILVQCMVGDTPVLMADGTEKPLRDVRVGDAIATYESGRISTSVVRNWANQGPDRVFTIRTTSGTLVTANERHPFLVKTGGSAQWIRLRELKVGDEIVAVTPNGGRCVGPSAPRMDATVRPNAKATACPTTTSGDGRPASARRPSIRNHAAPPTSGTGTGSTPRNTAHSSESRTGSVLCAGNRPGPMSAPIGAGNSASITTTRPARCEDYSATIATSRSDMGRPRRFSSGPLDTFGIIPEEIVEIVTAGCEDVFDIEVEGTENFIANGLVSHNTRWNADDLAGRILEWAARGEEPWTILNFPALAEEDDPLGRQPGEALWPERYDRRYLEVTREQDSWAFAALYQGQPRPRGGGLFQEEWIRGNLVSGCPDSCDWVRAWDFASSEGKGDYTAGVLMGRDSAGTCYVRDVVRGRWSPGRRDEIIKQTAAADAALVGRWAYQVRGELQPGAAGKDHAGSFVQMLSGFDVSVAPASGDKEVRARPFASQCEFHHVKFFHGDFLPALQAELCDFPRGKYDDQVDACSYAFNCLALAGGSESSPATGEDRADFVTGGL